MGNEVQKCEAKEVADYMEPVSAVERMIERGVDPSILEKFMDLQERALNREAKKAFNAAMVRAQAKMPIVPKDAKNNQTNSWYSKYETILKHCKPIYTAEGFSVSFYEEDSPKAEHIRVCADVMHEDGWTEKRHVDEPIDSVGIKGTTNKTLVHAKGSSFTYGRGKLMKLIFNIPTGDDDDGNAAGGAPVMEFITEKQAIQLTDLAEAAKGGIEKFEKYLNNLNPPIESIDKIPAAAYGTFHKILVDAQPKGGA